MTAAADRALAGRGRLRSRLRFGLPALALLLLAGCADHFGPGLVQLAAGRGWEPLPIRNWVVNDGVTPKAIVYCPPEDCVRPGVAASITPARRSSVVAPIVAAINPPSLWPKIKTRPASTCGCLRK